MTSSMRTCLVALALLTVSLSLPAAAAAQSLRGLVLERDTDRPVALATVHMVAEGRDTVATVITDENGFFSVTADERGTFVLVVDALGYRAVIFGPYEVEDDQARVVQVSMAPLPVRIGGLDVATERDAEPEVRTLAHSGFYERLAEGRGEFITPGEIARSSERWTQGLFWPLRSAVVVHGSRGWGPWDDRVVLRARMGGYCSPRVWVDGVEMKREDVLQTWSLSDLVPKDELLAVEVYQAPWGAPPIYQGTDECGVILFWTTAY